MNQRILLRATLVVSCALLASAPQAFAKEQSAQDKATQKYKVHKSSKTKFNLDKVNSGCNIFSDQDELAMTPTFRTLGPATGDAEKLRNMIEIEANRYATASQLKQIPSLTLQQRKEITKIYDALKLTLAPLIQELKDNRPKSRKEFQQYLYGPAKDLLQKIEAKRLEAWEQVKALLSEHQLEELEQMRHGEMLTGLNAPMTPPGLNGDEKFRPAGIMAPPPGTTMAPVDSN